MIDLLLREAGVFLLCGLDALHQGVQIFLRKLPEAVDLDLRLERIEICHILLAFPLLSAS